MENLRGQTNRRRRIALSGFSQNLALGDLRKLANDLVPQMLVGKNPDSLGRQNRTQPIDGLLDQGAVAE